MYKRIVVKIGTNVISKDGSFSEKDVRRIAAELVHIRELGIEVVAVTSGAFAAGRRLVSPRYVSDPAQKRQVMTAVGQVELMSIYARAFNEEGTRYRCAQILVTKGDFRDKEHYAHMKRCFEDLLREDIIPIVNANDAISMPKLGFNENDELTGLVAAAIDADAAIFLTSVDGVMTYEDGKATGVVEEIRENDLGTYERHISNKTSESGTGGMRGKFAIAKRLMAQGATVHIANGKTQRIALDIVEGKRIGTVFIPTKKLSAVKRRLAYSDGLAVGVVYVDKGAEKLLLSKKSVSLLPVGAKKIEGEFKKGDTIEIRDEMGNKVGFGIAQYGASEAAALLGRKGAPALIHYNYMTIIE